MGNNILFNTQFIKAKRSNKWPLTFFLLGLALATWIILLFAARNPNLVENLYSSTIYPYIAKGTGFLSGVVPFSIVEVAIILLIPFIISVIIIIIIKPRLILNNFTKIFHYIVRLLATIYVLFYLLWGFNYFRQDYAYIANMNDSPTTYTDLKELTLIMIEKSNETRKSLPEDDNGVFLIEDSFSDLGRMANDGFTNYKVGDIDLSGNYGRIKPVFLSKYMSYTGITGIFIPFTAEATINTDAPNHALLSSITHEMAHQRGFAKEDEANFIAYKANINNPDERFQYSGYYLAMNHLLNEVYRENPDDYMLLFTNLNDGVKRDMEYASQYWKSKEGRIQESVNNMNDNYLKANNQTEGIKSYNGVVRLLLSEYMDQETN